MTTVLIAALVALPTYRQTVVTEWPDEQAARAATAELSMLGAGERFVWTGRWDDRNVRSLAVAKALSPLGFKSTFITNGSSTKDYVPILRELVARGNSIGCHTIAHAYMSRLLPARSFREILQNRIELEVDAQSPVCTLGMPYGLSAAGSAAAGFDNVRVVGEAARNAGLLGGAEGDGSSAKSFGLADDEWVGMYVFRANDKKPDRAVFAKGYAAGTNLVARGGLPGGPCITLGVHPWQSDAGLVDLAAMVKEAMAVSGTVFMTQNEYVASRLQFLHATVRKAEVSGRKAVFEIVRPQAYALGAAVPLNLKLSDGRILKVPPGKESALPTAFGRIDGALTVSDDDGTFTLNFTNTMDRTTGEVSFTLRLPPGYAPGVQTKSVRAIAPGKSVRIAFKAAVPENPLFREGTLYAAVEINLPGRRLWAPVAKVRGAGAKIPYPRDMTVCTRPFPVAETPSPAALAEMSVVGAELKGDWHVCDGSDGDEAAWAVTGYRKGDRNKVRKLVGWSAPPEGQGYAYLLAVDFDADTAAHGDAWTCVFAGGHIRKTNLRAWLNGGARDVPAGEMTLRNGRNRLVVLVTGIEAEMFSTELAIRSGRDGSSVRFVTPNGKE